MNPSRPVSPLWFAALGLALLAANLLWLPPLLQASASEGVALAFYAILRFAIVLVMAFAWIYFSKLSRKSALVGTTAVILAEQFFLRGGSLLLDAYQNPEAWAGASLPGIVFGLFMGTVVFLPVVLIIAWLGTEFATLLLKRKVPTALS
jgi:hypothetical protein